MQKILRKFRKNDHVSATIVFILWALILTFISSILT
jgi:hypothetical protein